MISFFVVCRAKRGRQGCGEWFLLPPIPIIADIFMRVKRRPRGVGFCCFSFAGFGFLIPSVSLRSTPPLSKRGGMRWGDASLCHKGVGFVRLTFVKKGRQEVGAPYHRRRGGRRLLWEGERRKEIRGGRGEMRRKTTPSRDSGKAPENRSERLNPSDDFGKDDPVYGFKPSDYLLNMIFSLSNIFASSTASSAATTRLTAIVISTATGEARKEKMPFIARALLYSGMRYQR